MKLILTINTPSEALEVSHALKGRNPRLENLIRQNSGTACTYAVGRLGKRWLEAEDVILEEEADALTYAEELRFRWPELEAKLEGAVRARWLRRWLSSTPDQQREWMNDPKLDPKVTADIFLNTYSILTHDAQEFIIKQHPHLIRLIRNLYPTLKAKYAHELEMAEVDL